LLESQELEEKVCLYCTYRHVIFLSYKQKETKKAKMENMRRNFFIQISIIDFKQSHSDFTHNVSKSYTPSG